MTAETRAGLLAGLGAYLIWGLLPVYLKLLTGIPAADVLSHRIVWSLFVIAAIAAASGGGRRLRDALARPRVFGMLLLSALCIAGNWLVYTWAVLNGHLLDASLGYFINPLISVVFGVVLLGERLSRTQWLAVGCAIAGVAVLTWALGQLPLLSLALAISFATYGLIRKQVPVDAVTGLLIETLLLTPLALAWLLTRPASPFDHPRPLMLLLIASGIATALPLLLFGFAARRLKLSTLGLMQYLSPSMVFLLAVFVYGEALDPWHLAAFACIWTGLAIYTVSLASTRSVGAPPLPTPRRAR